MMHLHAAAVLIFMFLYHVARRPSRLLGAFVYLLRGERRATF